MRVVKLKRGWLIKTYALAALSVGKLASLIEEGFEILEYTEVN